MAEFRMPSLGADMERGTLLEWRIAPGDLVSRGDIVAVVDTDKSDIEVEVFESGVIEELLVPEGAEVAVGTALARIGPAPSSPVAAPAADHAREPAPVPESPPVTHPSVFSPLVRHRADELGVDLATVAGTGPGQTITRRDVERAAETPEPARADSASPPGGRAAGSAGSSPYARRRAEEAGVALAGIAGTGPGGAVVAADVDRALDRAGAVPDTPVPVPGTSEPIAESIPESIPAPPPGRRASRQQAARRAVARLMARSKREIPHYYLSTTIDLAPAVAWLAETNADRSVTERILPAALLLKATALAASRVPELNGHWIDDAFAPAGRVDLGVAVSLRGGGLVAPAIHRADELAVDELMATLRDLVTRARAGALTSSEMADPSLTVTNLGDQGVEAVFGVIYPPQVALVGFGKIVERPWAAEGMLGIHPCVTATLSADHRASDGHRGATFLATIDRLLAEPATL